ncbi:MAG: Asp-tRNA(Asn)/Glu-tRNA(Gln) amidotransferase subunit GatB [Bacteroidota bacterium]
MTMTTYETVIGLEVHVQLATDSKAFCGDKNEFGAAPNRHVSAISLGYPGTLPRLNEKQLQYAVQLGQALNCKINRHSSFDRKNYFYADLPKGYQITQDRAPICLGGELPIRLKDGTEKNIRIHHIHMEEDAGKSIHGEGEPFSYVDLNRAGTPLLEIVTEPDLRSAEEVDAFMSGIRQLVRYLGISDGNMQEGSLRCDVNISVRPEGQQAFGQRCEIKNMNSMRYARNAISYEVARQINLIEGGGQVEQQTRQYNPKTGKTTALRAKEDAHDYRYFPEPDLPPFNLAEDFIEANQPKVQQLPWEAYRLLRNHYQLSVEDCLLLSEEHSTCEVFLAYAKVTGHTDALAKLFLNKIIPWLSEQGISARELPLSAKTVDEYLQLVSEGKVSASAANARLFPALLAQADAKPEQLAQELALIQNTDTSFLERLVDEVIAANPDKVATYKKGKKGLIGFFMGEIMKKSKGQAGPKETQALLRKKLDN